MTPLAYLAEANEMLDTFASVLALKLEGLPQD